MNTVPNGIGQDERLTINFLAGVVVLGLTAGINVFLSRFIVQSVGVEAFGFVQLSNTLISYIAILTIALNSMSSRFVSVSYFRKDASSANGYFASTFFANLGLVIVLIPAIVFGALHIAHFVNVTPTLLPDVQWLLVFTGVSFLVTLLATNLSVPYYVTNKLYLASGIDAGASFLRATLLIALFGLFEPRIQFVSLAALATTLFTQMVNLHYKKELTPDLSIQPRNFSWTKVKELLSCGVWNSVTQLGNTLSVGLDLVIANLVLGATAMGVLAVSKIVPNLITMVLYQMIAVFMPGLTELHARQNLEAMALSIRHSMKVIGVLINVPIALLIVFGDVLYSLWFPSEDSHLLHVLSTLTVVPWAVMGQATVLHNVFMVINRIKTNSVLITLTGLLNLMVVVLLLRTTSWGLFAIAGVSSVLSIVRNLAFTVPFGAKYLNRTWHEFYPEVAKSVLTVLVITSVGWAIRGILTLNSWQDLVIAASLTGALGVSFNLVAILSKSDRTWIREKLAARLWRAKSAT